MRPALLSCFPRTIVLCAGFLCGRVLCRPETWVLAVAWHEVVECILSLCRVPQICVRDVSKKRSFELEKHTTMVTNYDGEAKRNMSDRRNDVSTH